MPSLESSCQKQSYRHTAGFDEQVDVLVAAVAGLTMRFIKIATFATVLGSVRGCTGA